MWYVLVIVVSRTPSAALLGLSRSASPVSIPSSRSVTSHQSPAWQASVQENSTRHGARTRR